jgi:hypothetical protein
MDYGSSSDILSNPKAAIAARLRLIRLEFFADEGPAGIASMLKLSCSSWSNYESGVTIPEEILLQFLELTGVNPLWLLHGFGEKFRLSPD